WAALESPWPAMVTRARKPTVIAAAALAAAIVAAAAVTLGVRWMPVGAPPAEAMKWYDEAQQALAERATLRALNDINHAIPLAARFAPLRVALAEIEMELDRPARAQEAMLSAVELAPDRSRLHADERAYFEGIQQLLIRDCDKAIASLEKQASAVADSQRAYRLLGVARAMQRCSRPDDAARSIEDAGRIDPRNPAVP